MYSNMANSPMAVIDNDSKSQYINSFCVTTKGTWLISVTCSDTGGQPYYVYNRQSKDKGKTWSERKKTYDPNIIEGKNMAIEMGQLCPVAIDMGQQGILHRIYQFHVIRNFDIGTRFGRMAFQYSDDDGMTFVGPNGPDTVYEVDAPLYSIVTNQYCWHLMAPWVLLSGNRFMLPIAVATDPPSLADIRSETVMMYSDNILSETDPTKIKFEFSPKPPHGITVPVNGRDDLSLSQEAQVVELIGGRLMCVMRTGNGCIYYSVSEDKGLTWSGALPLRYRDGGDVVLHPNAPCPFQKLSDGRYSLLYCNNNGDFGGGTSPYDHTKNRNPIYIAIGRETGSKTGQPLEFSEPKLLCSIENFRPGEGWRDLTYGYFMEYEGEYYHIYNALWQSVQINKVDPRMTL